LRSCWRASASSSWLQRRDVDGLPVQSALQCQNDAATVRDWWDAKLSANQQKTARDVSAVRGLRERTDDVQFNYFYDSPAQANGAM